MKISVVIPLYNKKYIIEECIRSVAAQTNQPYEIIIVDDGSTDGSYEQARSCANKLGLNNLILIRTQNGGVSKARNKGTIIAKGDFVCFLDADDEWDPDYLKTIVCLIEDFPDCDVYSTGHLLFKKVTGEHEVIRFERDCVSNRSYQVRNFFISSLGNSLVNSSKVGIRKSVLFEYGLFPENAVVGEDLYFWIKVLLDKKLAHCPRKLVKVNQIEDFSRLKRKYVAPYPVLKYVDEFKSSCFSAKLYIYRIALAHLNEPMKNGDVESYRKLLHEVYKVMPIAAGVSLFLTRPKAFRIFFSKLIN